MNSINSTHDKTFASTHASSLECALESTNHLALGGDRAVAFLNPPLADSSTDKIQKIFDHNMDLRTTLTDAFKDQKNMSECRTIINLTSIVDRPSTISINDSCAAPIKRSFFKNPLFDIHVLEVIEQFAPESMPSFLASHSIFPLFKSSDNQELTSPSDSFISLKSTKDLNELFLKASVLEHGNLLLALIRSSRFNEIHQESLEKAFCLAADHYHAENLRVIIESIRFDEISKKTFFKVFFAAALNISTHTLDELIRSGELSDIFDNEQESSEEFFSQLDEGQSEKGHANVLQELIKSNRFSQIPKKMLSQALQSANRRDHTDIRDALIRARKFSEISKKTLEPAPE